MRALPRVAFAVLTGAALLVGCTSASQSKATQPSTLAVGSAGGTSSTVAPTGSTVSPTGTTLPATTLAPTTLASTTLPSTTVAPTSTAPAGATVTIARGEFITTSKNTCTPTTCKYVQITSSGWDPKQPISVTCYSDSGSSGPYAKFADSSGNLSAATTCFFGNAFHVYVEIDGVRSNVITPWKNW